MALDQDEQASPSGESVTLSEAAPESSPVLAHTPVVIAEDNQAISSTCVPLTGPVNGVTMNTSARVSHDSIEADGGPTKQTLPGVEASIVLTAEGVIDFDAASGHQRCVVP